jgi:hypothetical protein
MKSGTLLVMAFSRYFPVAQSAASAEYWLTQAFNDEPDWGVARTHSPFRLGGC